MANTTSAAEPGHWFLRGVQSAIFYYVSFTPCLEFQHKRKRRKEAKAHNAQQETVVTTQPGVVRQPGPFQTNETWAEELMLGPGPPKGWKGDKLLERLQKKVPKPVEVQGEAAGSAELPETAARGPSSLQPSTPHTETTTRPSSSETATVSSEEAAAGGPKAKAVRRPSLSERRLSSAVENIKDSLRTTLHPEKWNWKRYEREDEVLWGFSETMTRMWNRATSGVHQDSTADRPEGDTSTHRRRRAPTTESDRYDYLRVRHPEVNDLHPPVVSQLPATRDEAAWMMLPPPSAAVMAGRKRPGAETEMRWPLAVIGSSKRYQEPKPALALTLSTEDINDRSRIGKEHDRDSQGQDDSDMEYGDETSFQPDELLEPPTAKRIKYLSDPLIRLSAASPPPSTTGDPAALKRRDSWQIHYVIPPERPVPP